MCIRGESGSVDEPRVYHYSPKLRPDRQDQSFADEMLLNTEEPQCRKQAFAN